MAQQGKNEDERSAIGYVRVSHPDHVAEGISLDAQATLMQAYCTNPANTLFTSVRK